MDTPFGKILKITEIKADYLIADYKWKMGFIGNTPSNWKVGNEIRPSRISKLGGRPGIPEGESNARVSVENLTTKSAGITLSWEGSNSMEKSFGQSSEVGTPVTIDQYKGFDKEHTINKKSGNNILLDDGSKWNLTDFRKGFELDWEKDETVMPSRGSSANKMNFSSKSGSKICKMINTSRNGQELTATYLEE